MVCASRPIDTPQSGSTTWRADRTADRDAAAMPSRASTPRCSHIVRKTPTRSGVGIAPVTGSPESSAMRGSRALARGTATCSSGSGPSSTSSTAPTRHTPKNHTVACSSPNTPISSAARNGPTNMPSRKVPPSSDSARARNSSGTRVVMNECRARPNAAALSPMTKTDAVSTSRFGARASPTTPRSATTPPTAIVTRSPMRATAHPAGRFPKSCPTTSAEATSAAVGTSAPRFAAKIGSRGMTAPSPRAKSTVGP